MDFDIFKTTIENNFKDAAARRISEQTGEPAATLPHMLGLGYSNSKPKVLNADVVVVDESSMNDIDLAGALFSTSLVGKNSSGSATWIRFHR